MPFIHPLLVPYAWWKIENSFRDRDLFKYAGVSGMLRSVAVLFWHPRLAGFCKYMRRAWTGQILPKKQAPIHKPGEWTVGGALKEMRAITNNGQEGENNRLEVGLCLRSIA